MKKTVEKLNIPFAQSQNILALFSAAQNTHQMTSKSIIWKEKTDARIDILFQDSIFSPDSQYHAYFSDTLIQEGSISESKASLEISGEKNKQIFYIHIQAGQEVFLDLQYRGNASATIIIFSVEKNAKLHLLRDIVAAGAHLNYFFLEASAECFLSDKEKQSGLSFQLDRCELRGENARCITGKASLLTASAYSLYDIWIAHLAPKTFSQSFFRSVAKDQSKLVGNGNLRIENTALQSSTYINLQALLASTQSHASMLPHLDVRCTQVEAGHSAGVAPIEKNLLYYMESRGLSSINSLALLEKSFLFQAFAHLPKYEQESFYTWINS